MCSRSVRDLYERVTSPASARASRQAGRRRPDTGPVDSEVRRDVVLRTTMPGLEGCYERILADLQQTRRAVAFLHDDGGRALDQGFMRDPIEIPGPLLP